MPIEDSEKSNQPTRVRVPTFVIIVAIAAIIIAVVASLVLFGKTADSSTPATGSNAVTLCPAPCATAGQSHGRAVTFAVPAGFVASDSFRPVTPIFSSYDGRYLRITAGRDSNEVLAIITYALPSDLVLSTSDARLNAVQSFNATQNAQLTSTPALTRVGRLSAITQSASQPLVLAGDTAVLYQDKIWYVFLPQAVVQIVCQSRRSTAVVDRGCQELLSSLKPI